MKKKLQIKAITTPFPSLPPEIISLIFNCLNLSDCIRFIMTNSVNYDLSIFYFRDMLGNMLRPYYLVDTNLDGLLTSIQDRGSTLMILSQFYSQELKIKNSRKKLTKMVEEKLENFREKENKDSGNVFLAAVDPLSDVYFSSNFYYPPFEYPYKKIKTFFKVSACKKKIKKLEKNQNKFVKELNLMLEMDDCKQTSNYILNS